MSPLLAVYQIGMTRIEVWADNVRTILWDGSEVVAQHKGNETLQDCIDHEISHTWRAWEMHKACSPVMWHLAHPEENFLTRSQQHAEEVDVMGFQRTLTGERPWEPFRIS